MKNGKTLLEAKQKLLAQINRTALWRLECVKRFPKDKARNNNSSEELYRLFDHVTELGSDHPVFIEFMNMDAMDRDKFDENLRRYGFGFTEEDPDQFIYEKMFKYSRI
jgi:hypothetical protein